MQPDNPTAIPKIREFGDVNTTRSLLYDNTLREFSQLPAVSNANYSLKFTDLHYADPPTFSKKQEKDAILNRQTLARRLRGTAVLTDTAGNVVQQKKLTLAAVPHLTSRGVFIHRGNAYTMASQLRLRPGIYTRVRDNGEVEAHVNVAKGLGHHLSLEPETGLFKIRVGQSRVPAYSVLRAIGITDDQLKETLGRDLFAANVAKNDPRAVLKVYSKLANKPQATQADAVAGIRDVLAGMSLDAGVTRRTLRQAYTNVTPEALLATVKKMLAVSQQKESPDDRDALAFQRVMGPEDLFAERARKATTVARALLWKAAARQGLDRLSPRSFQGVLDDLLLNSGLAQPLEEVNAAEVFDQQTRITKLGVGGIPSRDSIPDESRNVHPSQYGFIDYIRTPESGSSGVDLRTAMGAFKGEDGQLYTRVRLRDGKDTLITPDAALDHVIAFPGQMENNKSYAIALKNNKVVPVLKEEVTAEYTDANLATSAIGNLVALKSGVKGQRMMMGARMLTQALPLVDGEAPYVQSGTTKGGPSYEELLGEKFGAVRYKGDERARVKDVTADEIVLQTPTGEKRFELYNYLPGNRKTYTHQEATVKPGDLVEPGQLLAKSNFTDASGAVALGKNARTVYLPFYGHNVDDAIVVSESFAKRMRSQHAYRETVEWSPDHVAGKRAHVSLFPGKYDRKILDNIDDDGVVRAGTVVNYGDPLILRATKKVPDKKRTGVARRALHDDTTVTWTHHTPGEVLDVRNTDKGTTVIVKTEAQLQEGDKLSGLYGEKGIVSKILPDAQMPHDDKGPYEVILSTLGLTSRANPTQIFAAALGRVAAETGKPYKLVDFKENEKLTDMSLHELRKNGMNETSKIFDPHSGRTITDVYSGNRWIMKLHHMAADKNQGRGLGRYTAEGLPARGSDDGGRAKRLGMLEVSSLLSHGATNVLRDARLLRGQANPEYWLQYMSGGTPKPPKVPFVYEKFVNSLRAAGINVVENGPKTQIMALTNRDVEELAGNREIKNAETVNWKNMEPVKGGLFSPDLTGGHGNSAGAGRRWSYIKLHEPMLNPIMEEPTLKLLGLTKQGFRDVLSGKESLGKKTGPQAIAAALRGIDVDKEIALAKLTIQSGKKTKRDDAVKRLAYLSAAKSTGIHPGDWVLDKVPVLPPVFRPVSQMGSKKLPLVADANFLYKSLFTANQLLSQLQPELGDEGVADERLQVYDTFKALTGLGDPVGKKDQEREVTGILSQIFGKSPKYGTVQQRLLSGNVDMVGRGVIAPAPSLNMDQIGIPETHAWDIYSPHIVRRLVRRGMSRQQALEQVDTKSQLAKDMLIDEMQVRPVIASRAPTWHKFGILAFWPQLVKGDIIRLSPIVASGFGADYDGDQMNFHVPASEDEVKDAIEKMLPSKNLSSASDYGPMYAPHQDYQAGLYEATARVDKQRTEIFNTIEEVLAAYRRGDLTVGTPVRILRDSNK